MNKLKQKHEFAFFTQTLPSEEQTITIHDQSLVHRITDVLRLTTGDALVLFNQKEHIKITLTEFSKKTVVGVSSKILKNKKYRPEVTLLLPVLKRESLEAAIYGAVECGVSKIQLIMTQKVQRKWGGVKELERLQRVAIAAAEQSKCFAFADIKAPINLEKAVEALKGTLLFADPAGVALQPFTEPCSVLIGPEGDLTEGEKTLIKNVGAIFFRLTPTILRATQAAVLAVGLIRSF